MKAVIRKFAAVLGVSLIGMGGAQAISLSPGGSIALPAEPEPVGASIVDTLNSPYVAPTFSGTLVTTVWSGDTSNPHGGLTFTYQLSNNGFDSINRLTLSSYSGFLTDASYSGAGVVPLSVVRNGVGNQISFNFEDALNQATLGPGQSSPVLILQTDSAGYQNSLAGVINSSAVNVATFAPLAVPEPASVVLLALGAVAIALRRFRQ